MNYSEYSFEERHLNRLLECITKEQKEKFFKLFPSGVSAEAMRNAILLVERTIDKNKREGVDIEVPKPTLEHLDLPKMKFL